MMSDQITVVGAGVAGLTCAVRLLEGGHAVRVVAAELSTDPPRERTSADPPGVCSPRAAAVWYPYAIEAPNRVARWSNASLRRYRELAARPDSGVSIITLSMFFSERLNPVTWELLGECEREAVPPYALPPGYELGLRLRVPFIDTTVFLPFLEARVRALGGTLERRAPLGSMEEVRSLGGVVVNCTGLGAKALCGDARMVPLRGQVLRVRAPGVNRWTVALPRGGHPTYVFPRSGDCVLGGTEERGEWGERPNEETLRTIEETCRWLEPLLLDGYEVLEASVGLRPGRRDGVRLEAEALDGRAVIHNYGHGGAGFTVAWGCADEVAELVARQLAASA